MAVIKIVSGKYQNKGAVEKTIRYVTGNNNNAPENKVLSVGGLGVDYENFQNAIDQFKITKSVYHKEDKRQVLHMVVSFDDKREKSLQETDIEELGYQIGKLLSRESYQTIWGIHGNTDHVHIHYIINSVSYETGKKYRIEREEADTLRREINTLIAPKIYSSEEIMELYKEF